MIQFYYGLSGTFKGTTMKKRLEKDNKLKVMWSMIKPWKNLENDLFSGLIEYNDLNYALLHLCMLEATMNNLNDSDSGVLIERGVTDMLFYEAKNMLAINDRWVDSVVKYEESLCKEKPEKILLIQNDVEFIKDVVLKEPSRKEKFPGGVEDYLRDQKFYVDFTKRHNDITEIIEITDAKDYITNTLGMEFNILNI